MIEFHWNPALWGYSNEIFGEYIWYSETSLQLSDKHADKSSLKWTARMLESRRSYHRACHDVNVCSIYIEFTITKVSSENPFQQTPVYRYPANIDNK